MRSTGYKCAKKLRFLRKLYDMGPKFWSSVASSGPTSYPRSFLRSSTSAEFEEQRKDPGYEVASGREQWVS